MSNEEKWIGCRFDVALEHFDYMEATLKEYAIGDWVIAHEMSSKSHYHILFWGSERIYRNLSKKLKEKFNLNANGKKHEYRKEPEIRSKEQYNIYILKDGNYRSNMSREKLEELYNKSYQKRDDNPLNKEIAEQLIEENISKELNIPRDSYKYCDDKYTHKYQSKILIINKLLKNKAIINKCRVNKIYQLYIELDHEHGPHFEHSTTHAELIYNNLF